jgi:hypothetical protein
MPSSREEIERVLQKLTDVRAFLRGDDFVSLPISMPTKFEKMRQAEFDKVLNENLKKLRTSKSALSDLDQRDKFNNPTFEGTRHTYLDDSSEVITYFETELLPAVTDLYKYLNDQPPAHMLAANLSDILSEKQAVAVRTSGGRVDMSQGRESTAIPQYSSVTDYTIPADEPRTIHVSQLNKLRAYQDDLKKYVDGYLKSSERWAQCGDARSALEKAQHKTMAGLTSDDEDWEIIRSKLSRASMSRVLPDALTMMSDELKDLTDKFSEELNKAQMAIEKVADSPEDFARKGIESAIKEALRYINNAIARIEDITRKCRESANAEMGHIEALIQLVVGSKKGDEMSKAVETRIGSESASRAPQSTESRQVDPAQR